MALKLYPARIFNDSKDRKSLIKRFFPLKRALARRYSTALVVYFVVSLLSFHRNLQPRNAALTRSIFVAIHFLEKN
jgi:hypothetical protein